MVFGCWIIWIDKGAASTPDQHARNSFCRLGALFTWLPNCANGARSSLGRSTRQDRSRNGTSFDLAN